MIRRLWRRLKTWRRFGIGPVALVFRLDRAVRVTPGKLAHREARSLRRTRPAAHAIQDVELDARPAPSDGAARGRELAVIVGVGPGFGYALARRLAADGFDLVLVSRAAHRLDALVDELHGQGATVESRGADATDETAVRKAFADIASSHGVPSLVVYSLQYTGPGDAVEIELPAFETAWRHNCLGAFIVARNAATLMLDQGRGSIVMVGSTSSLVGRAGHLNLAVGKFGQRALAQVMARELWPRGIHVAHAVIDADIAEEGQESSDEPRSDPADIAASILSLHRQPRSAWTSELDLRPWNERFWEHC